MGSKKKDFHAELDKLSFTQGGKLTLELLDTHCHFDMLKKYTPIEIIEKAHEIGMHRFITIATQPENISLISSLVNKHPELYGSLGVHPHYSDKWSDDIGPLILERARTNLKIVAIGEMGLDYHYDYSSIKTQRKVFEKQLEIAVEAELPVVIHTREAEEDTLCILKNISSSLVKKGVLHSYTSNIKLANWALSNDFYIGFNGIISFKNAQNVRDVLMMTPLERILFETDAPFLSPIPFRGLENSSLYLPFIANEVAKIRNISPEILLPQVMLNSKNLFFRLK